MIGVLKDMVAFEPVLYLCLFYAVSRLAGARGNGQQRFVLDVVFIVWAICSILREAIGYHEHLPLAYVAVDSAAALWLASKERGRVSGIAETWFLGMILFNFIIWSKGESGWMLWTVGAALSIGQIIHIAGGIMRHEIRGLATRAAARLGLRRHLAVDQKKVGDQ